MESGNKLAAEESQESLKCNLKQTFACAQGGDGATAKRPRLDDGNEPEDDGPEGGEVAIDTSTIQDTKDLSANLREVGKTFILYIPLRGNSKTEGNALTILKKNFQRKKLARIFTGSKNEGSWTQEIYVNPLPGNPRIKVKPKLLISSVCAPSQREAKNNACAKAVANLKKYCTYIEPNPEWFNNGETPDFIRDRIPCNKTPRTYLIFTKKDTGQLTPDVVNKYLQNLKSSSQEEVYFVDDEYTMAEKTLLLNISHTYQLRFRHFGPGPSMDSHYVCIFKKKSIKEILEKAEKNGWKHPWYIVKPKDPSLGAQSPLGQTGGHN